MSHSLFDQAPILLPPTVGTLWGPSLKISGELGKDEEKKGIRRVHVFVVIEQAAREVDPSAADEARVVAVGDNVVEGEADTLNKWTVAVPDNGFKQGAATGTALTVEYTGDPPGFDTYIWTQRLRMELAASGSTSP